MRRRSALERAPRPSHHMATKKKRKKKPALTARTADKQVLYQESVQDTETEASFLARTFDKMRGRPAKSLREDFCGTALLCAENRPLLSPLRLSLDSVLGRIVSEGRQR